MSELVALGVHISVQKGKTPIATGYSGIGAEPYLNPEFLRGKAQAELVKAGRDAVRARDGDTILLWDGSNAGEFFRAKAGLVASTMAKISPSKSFRPKYFFHVTKHAERYLKTQTSGTGIPHVDRELLEAIRVYCPGAPEQQRITEILDTIDTAIRETEAIIAKLKAIKQGLLQDMLTRGVDANGKLRPPQMEAPHLYKASTLGWIPKDWETLPLEKITSTPICYGIVQVLDFVPNGVPVLAIRDLHGDYTTGIHRTAARIDAAYPRSRVRGGDVLLSIKGTLGRVGVVPSHFTGNISRDIALIRPTARVRSLYLALMLQSTFGQRLLSSAQVGTTRGEISIAPLRQILAPLPDADEQQRIEDLCESTELRINQELLVMQKLLCQESGLKDDLLTGRVSVTPLLAAEQPGSA